MSNFSIHNDKNFNNIDSNLGNFGELSAEDGDINLLTVGSYTTLPTASDGSIVYDSNTNQFQGRVHLEHGNHFLVVQEEVQLLL